MDNHHTIASLAILKVHFDEYGTDYLDHLLPFVRYCIARPKLQTVSPSQISDLIKSEFGLNIPDFVCDTVLKRLAKEKFAYLKREGGAYIVQKELDVSSFEVRRSEVTSTVEALVKDLSDFAEAEFDIKESRETWEKVLIVFLNRHSIDCVKSYSRQSPLPEVELETEEYRLTYVVAKRLEVLRLATSPLWADFETLVKGRMLANALVCEDLATISKRFEGVSFYVDTPMVLSLLGLADESTSRCSSELIGLVKRLGGEWYIFNHTFDETENVLSYAIRALSNPHSRSKVAQFAREHCLSASDLELIKAKIEQSLNKIGIVRIATPRYVRELQISETDLKDHIGDEVRYMNPRALEYDINSIRSIVVLRAGGQPRNLEVCGHIFVTPNMGLAKTAWRFARQEDPAIRVSPVISDYSLVNIAWLKLPMGAPDLASVELMASCYAAMEPREPLWEKYYDEIERLRQRGDISEDDHYILRYSPAVQLELMDLTQGLEGHLTTQRVSVILDRVKEDMLKEVKKEVIEKETEIHRVNQHLEQEQLGKIAQQEKIASRCGMLAKTVVVAINVLVSSILIIAAIFSVPGFQSNRKLVILCIVMSLVFGLANAIWGFSIYGLGKKLERKLARSFSEFFLGK